MGPHILKQLEKIHKSLTTKVPKTSQEIRKTPSKLNFTAEEMGSKVHCSLAQPHPVPPAKQDHPNFSSVNVKVNPSTAKSEGGANRKNSKLKLPSNYRFKPISAVFSPTPKLDEKTSAKSARLQ